MRLSFKKIVIVVTVTQVIVTIILVLYLTELRLRVVSPKFFFKGETIQAVNAPFAEQLGIALSLAGINTFSKLILTATKVQIIWFWILAIFKIISKRQGVIATLVFFILFVIGLLWDYSLMAEMECFVF